MELFSYHTMESWMMLKEFFDGLKDSYSKTYLVSDNTGSGAASGGSDKLVEYMQEEYYTPALNTRNGVVDMTRPRQHRHLKRKDSIRFSVLLVFSNFYIYTGCRKGTSSRPPHPRKDLFKSS